MTKSVLILIYLVIPLVSLAQKNSKYNMEDGYVANGYDVVSYFDSNPKKGKTTWIHTFDGTKFRFENQSNLDLFKSDPLKYIPQYGGWCAYAVGTSDKRVKIDPNTYEIRNGKLYLFYNFYFNNTLDSWLEEGPIQLIEKADKNWEKSKQEK